MRMQIKFLTLFLISTQAFAVNPEQCALYEQVAKDLLTVEMGITSDKDCDIGDKKQKCTLKDLQVEYNALQAKNVLLFGVANLIDQMKKNLENLKNPSEVLENNVQDLQRIKNGAKVYGAIKDLTNLNSDLSFIDSREMSEVQIIKKLKDEFCKNQSIPNEELCSLLKESITSDGEVAFTQPTHALLGYVSNFSMLQSHKTEMNNYIKLKLEENESLFQTMKSEDVDKLIKEAEGLNEAAKCVSKKSSTDPCLGGKNLEDFKKDLASKIHEYNKNIRGQISSIQNKQLAENNLFDFVASKKLLSEDLKTNLTNGYYCFSSNAACERTYFSDIKIPQEINNETLEIDFKNTLFNEARMNSFHDYFNTSKFAQGAEQCSKDKMKDCFVAELTSELKRICPDKSVTFSNEDVLKDHVKVKGCLDKLKKDDLSKEIEANNKKILDLEKQMKAVHEKKGESSKNSIYKDIAHMKSFLFASWKDNCGYRPSYKPLYTCSFEDTLNKESPLEIFLDSNNKIIMSVNKDIGAEVRKNSYEIDKNNFCNPTYKDMPNIRSICANGMAALVPKKNDPPKPNDNDGGSSNGNFNSSKGNNQTKNKKTNEKNNREVGESPSTGQAIGSGLLSSLKYGMDTWRNFNQIRSFNQGMMNNAFMVRNAQLNPPHLSFNPPPPMYPPAMYTGTPLGYMNPYSSTFNYNNNSFYYNTYDPTAGTSLSTDTSFSFTP
jgi:hypothetical protein